MSDTAQLEAKWQAQLETVQNLNASIADSRRRYEATKDSRYLRSIELVLPLFRSALAKMQSIGRELNGKEVPSSFMLTLSATSDWLVARGKETAEGVTGTVAGIGNAAQDIGKNASSLVKWLTFGVIVVAVAYATGQSGPIIRAVRGK